ncbi:MAG: hypothetical protein AB1578_11290 [Thermodesulfobacteriota bacterium]
MPTQGDSLLKKTQRGLSILAFETTKQSRILKKRMRTAALQKEIKADLRDLGNLVYNAVVHDQPGILQEEEVKILVENIRQNKEEVEHLRDAIARLSRTRKHFPEGEPEGWEDAPEPALDEPPSVVVETSTRPPPADDTGVSTEREMKAEILQAPPPEPRPLKKAPRKPEAVEPAVPPPPGTDPEHPAEAGAEAGNKGAGAAPKE